jgi:ammonia channel protein AmtB
VQAKNEVNIMIKNVVDVVFGGMSYWMFGYGLSYGSESSTNPFCGIGSWFVTSKDPDEMGVVYSNFIFQLSFTTTATTIVSGAMAERTKLTSYIIFSYFNTLTYCFPAHWMWAENGFLRQLGCIDVAGSGPVHLLGGISALIGAVLLGPRMGRYDNPDQGDVQPCNPTNSVLGLFMLWWGWLAFNAGSTYGISGGKWKLASK